MSRTITYTCDRCGLESNAVMQGCSIDVKHGAGTHIIPDFPHCCYDCNWEMVHMVSAIMNWSKPDKTKKYEVQIIEKGAIE